LSGTEGPRGSLREGRAALCAARHLLAGARVGAQWQEIAADVGWFPAQVGSLDKSLSGMEIHQAVGDRVEQEGTLEGRWRKGVDRADRGRLVSP